MKKCKKCGKEIHSSTKKCLNCGKDQRFFLIRHPILLVFIIIIALLAIFTGKDGRELDITEADILEKKALTQEEKEAYNLGEIFINGYLDVKYIFVNTDFKRHGQYAHVKSQYDVVKAEFEFQNVSELEQLITPNDFKCYADEEECERFYNVYNASYSTKLSAGKKISRSVYFQIPATAKEVKIQYETPFATNGYVEFIVK